VKPTAGFTFNNVIYPCPLPYLTLRAISNYA